MTPPRKHQLAFLIDHNGDGEGSKTILDQVQHMRDRFDITILHGQPGHLARACADLGVRHIPLPLHPFWRLTYGLPLLALTLLRVNPDLLVLTGQPAGPVGALAGWLAGIRRMVYVAQWPSFYTNWNTWRMIRNYIREKIPCLLADRVVTLNEGNYYEYLFRELAGPGRLVLLSSWVDLTRTPTPEEIAETRRRLGWSPDLCHVVMVTPLTPQKQVDWLLDAWRLVMDQNPDARLWIVGRGSEQERLRQRAGRLELGDSCTFLGHQEDGIRFLAAADIVALTTLYEGHAVTVLEAMACGRPIVSNRVDGVASTVTDGREGFLTQPDDAGELADRLLALIRDPALRQAMGLKGLETAPRFSRPAVMDRFLALYESLLARKEPPP